MFLQFLRFSEDFRNSRSSCSAINVDVWERHVYDVPRVCLFWASNLPRLSSEVNKANPIRMKGNYVLNLSFRKTQFEASSSSRDWSSVGNQALSLKIQPQPVKSRHFRAKPQAPSKTWTRIWKPKVFPTNSWWSCGQRIKLQWMLWSQLEIEKFRLINFLWLSWVRSGLPFCYFYHWECFTPELRWIIQLRLKSGHLGSFYSMAQPFQMGERGMYEQLCLSRCRWP